MKKLALFMLLIVAVPLFAVISDAEYEQEVQKNKDRIDYERLQTDYPFALVTFAGLGNLPAVQYLVEVMQVNPNVVVDGFTALQLARHQSKQNVVNYLEEILEYYTPKGRLQ